MGSKLKTTCIIDSFNYGDFVIEAVNSVKNQTVSFDEIIVVDDCSTDHSVNILKENFTNDQQITLIFKEKNEGQLSAFNEGFRAATGDIIFFLDSDDVYQPEYLEEALKVYQNNKDCDFLFCAQDNFGKFAPQDKTPESHNLIDNYGHSLVLVWYLRQWIGGPTSTLSMRRRILNKVLPVPYLEDWITRADDCLVYGASLAGAKKFQLNKPLVRYRLHGSNNIFNKELSGDKYYDFNREISFDRLYALMRERMGYRSELADLAEMEFKTIGNPSVEFLLLYIKIIRLSSLSFSRKMKRIIDIVRYFFLEAKAKSA